MSAARNYQKELDALLASLEAGGGEKPPLLLHACCAPCLCGVLPVLTPYFAVTVLFYNPNIRPAAEFEKRREAAEGLCARFKIPFLAPPRDEEAFTDAARGLEDQPEGGGRCRACFALRLGETAKTAKALGFPWFATTLSVSPHKNAPLLNEIGEALAAGYGLSHLPSDFKKREGYKRSVALSREYGLYRQSYCGCKAAP